MEVQYHAGCDMGQWRLEEGRGRQANEVGRVGEQEEWGMPISGVNVLTRNIDLLARIDSSYALSNVSIRLLYLVLGSWQIRGCECPAS